jgi:hypothetical protein
MSPEVLPMPGQVITRDENALSVNAQPRQKSDLAWPAPRSSAAARLQTPRKPASSALSRSVGEGPASTT